MYPALRTSSKRKNCLTLHFVVRSAARNMEEFTSAEALEKILQPDVPSQQDSSSSSPDSDTGDSDPDSVQTSSLSSPSSSSDSEEDTEDPGSGWTGKTG